MSRAGARRFGWDAGKDGVLPPRLEGPAVKGLDRMRIALPGDLADSTSLGDQGLTKKPVRVASRRLRAEAAARGEAAPPNQ
ncbi:MAG TPA: hypothetical protein PLP04_07440 [Bryobacteraceae bacterium]|nr:hypothetical protein [Bryobacteraceae bacterium]HOL71775.1 hypothetical protein [Bryobacteraceae bacterium]HPQ15043.1 hypothetical protein [Bryobacteraceae bacterium]